jgi:predicted neutral ceramidase superfamily lipid hydrolase
VNRHVWIAVAGTLAAALLVWLLGSAMTDAAGRPGVLAGVAIAAGFQVLVLLATSAALPESRFAAFGVGMLGRMLLVVAAALAIVPATGLPPAPTLFSLVTVLFATTLLEPVAFAAGAKKKSR